MTTFKSLILITGLMFSIQSYAQGGACIPKDEKVAPPVSERTTTNPDGSVVDTQVWIDWKAQAGSAADVVAKQSLVCCATLEMNSLTRVCLDKSMVDSTLVKCSSQADCSGGKGCFDLREDDMFKLDDDSTDAQIEDLTSQQDAFEQQQEEVEAKAIGQSCARNMDCESYNCKKTTGQFPTCQRPETICRLADLGEVAMGSVKCEEPYQKDSTLKCVDTSASVFSGYLGRIVPTSTNQNNCQFELKPTAAGATSADISPAINLAITSSRSMEWLFSTTTHSSDCVKVVDFLKEKIKSKIDIRKQILRDYSLNTKIIEENFALINAAKQDVMEPILTLCGDTTTQHDVAMRRATGLDYLCYMKKRNELFLVYESDMLQWTSEMNAMIDQYRADVFNYSENQKEWKIGDKNYTWRDPVCRRSFLTPKKLKKRWDQKYFVRPDQKFLSVLHRDDLKNYLSYMGVNTPMAVSGGFFLDPVMPGEGAAGVDFKSFGGGAGLFSSSSHNRVLRRGEMADMHTKYNSRLVAFLKGLRLEEVGEDDFIYEPEMPASYEYRGCLNKIDSAECAPFKKYVTKLQDVAFAQFLTYSKHRKSKYKDYYRSPGTLRQKLWNRYTTDLTNLENYYTGLKELRTAQNICIDRVISQIKGGGFNGAGMGITQGAGNYYVDSGTTYTGGTTTPNTTVAPVIKSSQHLQPIKLTLGVYNKALTTTNNSASGNSGTGAGSGSVDAAAGSLAARNKTIADANSKASSSGYNLAKEESELRASLNPKSSSGGSGSSSQSSGSSNKSSSSDATGNKATLDAEGDGTSSAAATATGSSGASGAGAAPAAGTMSGLIGGAASGSASSEVQDALGMSDEEKDVMAANYDRTKARYNTTEDDTLFQVVSKTYVRNLDKILTRKKKLDDSAASAPSAPSTP